ncbi:hypothetical protein KC364_g76 [Hortaea werneckii]|nr:hypothetical protein KC364_g76 [Hortaea werneckii]
MTVQIAPWVAIHLQRPVSGEPGPNLEPSDYHENASQRQSRREVADVRQNKAFRKDHTKKGRQVLKDEISLHAAQKTRQTVYARAKQKNRITTFVRNLHEHTRLFSALLVLRWLASETKRRRAKAHSATHQQLPRPPKLAFRNHCIALIGIDLAGLSTGGGGGGGIWPPFSLISSAPFDFFISSELVESESDPHYFGLLTRHRLPPDTALSQHRHSDSCCACFANTSRALSSSTLTSHRRPSYLRLFILLARMRRQLVAGLGGCAPTPAAYAALASPLSPEYVDEPPEPPAGCVLTKVGRRLSAGERMELADPAECEWACTLKQRRRKTNATGFPVSWWKRSKPLHRQRYNRKNGRK